MLQSYVLRKIWMRNFLSDIQFCIACDFLNYLKLSLNDVISCHFFCHL